MKCVITILQNKRVAMPYIFGTYSLPMMRARFNGEIKLYHIFHASNGLRSQMTSNLLLGPEKVEQTAQFIKEGHYKNATIVSHKKTSAKWPTLPSLRIAVKIALKEKADFHLWLEDDAIVYDKDCDTWATTLGSADVGLYMQTDKKQLINTAYFLSTREYDERFARSLQEYDRNMSISANKQKWGKYAGHGSLIEHVAWRAARKPIFLGPDKAYRHHPHPTFTKTGTMVRKWLKETIPGISPVHLSLLKRDFDD
jgi:hypothetical protein